MEDSNWVVQVFAVEDGWKQSFLASVLRTFEDLVVQETQNYFHHYVAVECDGVERARWVHELVLTIDVDAESVYRSDGAAQVAV